VLLTDMWAAKDVPMTQALSAFQATSAEESASAGSAITTAIASAFADEPGVEVAFEQSVKEAKKVEGMPLKTVVHFVAVAPEKKFDRALATEDKPRSGGVLKAAGKGVLGGLLGGKKAAEQPAAEAEEPTQGTILKVITETKNISMKALDAKLFEVPAGYQEVTFEDHEEVRPPHASFTRARGEAGHAGKDSRQFRCRGDHRFGDADPHFLVLAGSSLF
jgi:hypothetical protein